MKNTIFVLVIAFLLSSLRSQWAQFPQPGTLPPVTADSVGCLDTANDHFYTLLDNNQLWRLDVVNNTWTQRASNPANVTGALAYGNFCNPVYDSVANKIYTLQRVSRNVGVSLPFLWRYDIPTNSWSYVQLVSSTIPYPLTVTPIGSEGINMPKSSLSLNNGEPAAYIKTLVSTGGISGYRFVKYYIATTTGTSNVGVDISSNLRPDMITTNVSFYSNLVNIPLTATPPGQGVNEDFQIIGNDRNINSPGIILIWDPLSFSSGSWNQGSWDFNAGYTNINLNWTTPANVYNTCNLYLQYENTQDLECFLYFETANGSWCGRVRSIAPNSGTWGTKWLLYDEGFHEPGVTSPPSAIGRSTDFHNGVFYLYDPNTRLFWSYSPTYRASASNDNSGCLPLAASDPLKAASVPVIGTTFFLTLTATAHSGFVVVTEGYDRFSYNGMPTPVFLGPGYGVCLMTNSMDNTIGLFPLVLNVPFTFALPIPNNPALAGLEFFHKWGVIDPVIPNTNNLAFTNQVEFRVGY